MPQWTQVYFYVFWPVLLAICCAALIGGDRPSRSTGILMLVAMTVASPMLATITFRTIEVGLAGVDVLLLLGLTWTALRSPKWWLILISSLQLLMVLGHVAKMIWPGSSRLTYAIMTGGAAYLQLILLSIGVLLAIRSRRSRACPPAINWPDGIRRNTGSTPTE